MLHRTRHYLLCSRSYYRVHVVRSGVYVDFRTSILSQRFYVNVPSMPCLCLVCLLAASRCHLQVGEDIHKHDYNLCCEVLGWSRPTPFLEVFGRAQHKGLVAVQPVGCLCDVWPDYDCKNVQNGPENRSVPWQFQEQAPPHADLRWQQHGYARKEDIFLHLEGNSDQVVHVV